MAVVLTESLERVHRIGPAVEAIERDELATLLGKPIDDVRAGLRALDDAIGAWGPERELDVLRYLYRRAARTEALYAPVVGLFPQMAIRPID